MTTEERLRKIELKVQKNEEKKNEEVAKEAVKIAEATEKIKALEPRISAILLIANKVIDEGLKFPSNYETAQYGYGNNCTSFIADGITHHVGFMDCYRNHDFDSKKKYNNIYFLGIDEGGACGPWDFYTDGENILLKHENTNAIKRDVELRYLNQFLKEFDSFETAFYNWIDSF